MLKREHRAADERLTELVAEVRSTVGGLDEDFGRSLIQPYTGIHGQLPALFC